MLRWSSISQHLRVVASNRLIGHHFRPSARTQFRACYQLPPRQLLYASEIEDGLESSVVAVRAKKEAAELNLGSIWLELLPTIMFLRRNYIYPDETLKIRMFTLTSGMPMRPNNTFHRGIQVTDKDGVAQYLTTFPGHYTGRATHIHILAHQNATVFKNGTVTSSSVSHVGQFFADQSLISKVEATAPYTSNAQTLTTNTEDGILSQEADTIDPVLEYLLVGDSIADGLMMWAAMGIDTSANHTVSAAASLTEDGGVANPNAGMGMGGPPGGPFGSGNSSASGSATADASLSSPSTRSSR
ncbi:Intradiol ring-cleavage dioxygenase [Mycena crocata]|nr:Intradiol ring-cleavage dioxygenase [Mycena crocata]